jgi:hypothetical protein
MVFEVLNCRKKFKVSDKKSEIVSGSGELRERATFGITSKKNTLYLFVDTKITGRLILCSTNSLLPVIIFLSIFLYKSDLTKFCLFFRVRVKQRPYFLLVSVAEMAYLASCPDLI